MQAIPTLTVSLEVFGAIALHSLEVLGERARTLPRRKRYVGAAEVVAAGVVCAHSHANARTLELFQASNVVVASDRARERLCLSFSLGRAKPNFTQPPGVGKSVEGAGSIAFGGTTAR